MAPEAAASDDDAEPPALPVNPDSRLEMPVVSDFSSGLKARRTARSEMRNASDFKTSSNCLPPVTEAENACVIARANPPALAVRSFVFSDRLSSVLEVPRRSVLSAMVCPFRVPGAMQRPHFIHGFDYRVPGAMRHSSCRFAEPGPYQAPVSVTVPVLRSI